MKLSGEAMKQSVSLITNALPFDFDHKSKSKEAILFDEIFKSISKHHSGFKDLEGFKGFLCKGIDQKPESQDAVKKIALDMKNILEQYHEESVDKRT